MEPLPREVRQAILDANPNATAEKIDEYEKLFSLRFSSDPANDPELADRERRLQELERELFPGKHRNR
jgi:hypothetical protein